LEDRVRALEETRAAAVSRVQAAEAEAERCRAERERAATEAKAAEAEVEAASMALDGARRAAAAAEIAVDLRAGEACPVCGSREHPAKMETKPALAALDLAERAREAAKRLEKAGERTLTDAIRLAGQKEDELRAQTARRAELEAELDGARAVVRRLASGEEVPRAVMDAAVEVTRRRDRAELALSALCPAARDRIRALAMNETIADAEAVVAALGRRAREAEDLARRIAEIRERAARSRSLAAARGEDVEREDRARLSADARLGAATSLVSARREEIRGMLASLQSGQHEIVEAPLKPRTAEQWISTLETRSCALVEREEQARAALDQARAAAERVALEAREASARRDEAAAQLARARAAVDAAMKKAGFESLDALRGARLEPAVLAALIADLERLDRERERLVAVLAERRRDATVEVTEEEASAAERAREGARKASQEAGERAAHALAHRDELARRRLRAVEIRAKIALLEPRAKRLAQIRQVVAANQLAEFAAERHLEAVTQGAAAILRTLSNDRYALVRTADGAFAVADSAHGGLVRAPSTLSGGETFLVSLALALSLSERIQLAGRTRFDFFFLDEGFGSLDAATLEIALSALERLRGPNRVIGMISHVAAIEERVPRKLRVLPGKPGGSASITHSPHPLIPLQG
jgi:exonuclease SbcC